jgi:hypothetical protein
MLFESHQICHHGVEFLAGEVFAEVGGHGVGEAFDEIIFGEKD